MSGPDIVADGSLSPENPMGESGARVDNLPDGHVERALIASRNNALGGIPRRVLAETVSYPTRHRHDISLSLPEGTLLDKPLPQGVAIDAEVPLGQGAEYEEVAPMYPVDIKPHKSLNDSRLVATDQDGAGSDDAGSPTDPERGNEDDALNPASGDSMPPLGPPGRGLPPDGGESGDASGDDDNDVTRAEKAAVSSETRLFITELGRFAHGAGTGPLQVEDVADLVHEVEARIPALMDELPMHRIVGNVADTEAVIDGADVVFEARIYNEDMFPLLDMLEVYGSPQDAAKLYMHIENAATIGTPGIEVHVRAFTNLTAAGHVWVPAMSGPRGAQIEAWMDRLGLKGIRPRIERPSEYKFALGSRELKSINEVVRQHLLD
jgi:hypothetical protein